MSEENNDFSFDASDAPAEGGHPQPDDPIEALSWALLDEQITDEEFRLLDTLLLSDDAARTSYVGCVQLHTDLQFHFGERQKVGAGAAAAKSPILGFLNDANPQLGMQPPKLNDSRS